MSKTSIEIKEDFNDGDPTISKVEYSYNYVGLNMNDLCERVLKPALLSMGYTQGTIDRYINSGE